MKQSILIVLLAMSVILFSKTAQAIPCKAQNNTEMLKCANLEYQEADEKLNNFWKKSARYVGYQFREFQKNWLEYREDFCRDEANKVTGEEVIKSIALLRCKTTLTKKRIEYFERIFD